MNKKDTYIVGLGNPGKEYINSRHNIGFLLVEKFSKKYNSNFNFKSKFKSLYSEVKLDDLTFKLFMPNTFMNNSGEAVKAIVDWYKVDLNQLIILVDDIDLPLGKVRFRRDGSSGGHNGLKSIIENLHTQKFKRIKVGIGAPPNVKNIRKNDTISHVLGNISSEEKLILNKVYDHVIKSLEQINTTKEDHIINSLNSFNNKHIQ